VLQEPGRAYGFAVQLLPLAHPGVEQNTNRALRHADFGYILETGRVVMEGAASDLTANEEVKEFHLGQSSVGRKSFRDVKHYRRRKRGLS
jgi:branched-chain amino acid transport system ATP-binding protein